MLSIIQLLQSRSVADPWWTASLQLIPTTPEFRTET
jgi:hypothetical protein